MLAFCSLEKFACLLPRKHSNRTFLLSASSATVYPILWVSYYTWGRLLSPPVSTPSFTINIHTYQTKPNQTKPPKPSILVRGCVSGLQATCTEAIAAGSISSEVLEVSSTHHLFPPPLALLAHSRGLYQRLGCYVGLEPDKHWPCLNSDCPRCVSEPENKDRLFPSHWAPHYWGWWSVYGVWLQLDIWRSEIPVCREVNAWWLPSRDHLITLKFLVSWMRRGCHKAEKGAQNTEAVSHPTFHRAFKVASCTGAQFFRPIVTSAVLKAVWYCHFHFQRRTEWGVDLVSSLSVPKHWPQSFQIGVIPHKGPDNSVFFYSHRFWVNTGIGWLLNFNHDHHILFLFCF